MILTLYMLMLITSTFTLLLASTPIMLGVNILAMALLLSATFAAFSSSWFAFLIFLIYVGGMLVMFAYFLAITPNQQMTKSNILTNSMITFITLCTLCFFINIKIPTLSTFIQGTSTLYSMNTAPFLIMLAMILLITMVIVVKITARSKGPLRPFD
uniref:NADH dehydrogenase subunit 6 n=1 Tax=Dendrobaena veneta TaxID=332521 RepID=UPI002551D0DE|nr:NADH dehydrogenase subunit 6 [Dendrobaena veneta]WGU49268.1 NADH dehydrogenase subunit 6 [Dendrobaena veneta]